MSSIARGQATKPSAEAVQSKADQTLENESLRASGSETKPAALRATGSAGAAATGTADLVRVVVALAVVIGVILVLRAVVARFTAMPGVGRPGRGGKMVTVLSRSMISPRQQILVLQVGRRLLVVGDSGGAMSQLCELSDPDEIASIVGHHRQPTDALHERKGLSFSNFFRRANNPFSEDQAGDETQDGPTRGAGLDENAGLQSGDELTSLRSTQTPVSVEEVGGLLDKIRQLQQLYKVKT